MSTNISHLTASLAIHPGEYLKDELRLREISQKDFALLTGIPQSQLNEIIKGKRTINADIAVVIGKALAMDASLWLSLQNNYLIDKARLEEKNAKRLAAIDQWQMIRAYIPEKFYKSLNVLTGNPIQDVPIVKDIYSAHNLDELAAVYSQINYARFRKSDKLSIDKINLVGWVKLVNHQALQLQVPKFDARKKSELIEALKLVFKKNRNTVQSTKDLLATYGIKLIVLPNPEKCPVDGISFWSNGNPAIGLSLRYKRIDNFSFNIMHELAHVYLHLTNNSEAEFIDLDKEHNSSEYKNSAEEIEADNFARNTFIDIAIWVKFLEENQSYSDKAIKVLSNKLKVHPAILQGRYCFEKKSFKINSSIDKSLQ